MMAVVEIARRDAGDGATPVRAAELAEAVGVPANYLSKILHQLARAGVLESERGPTGGFRLAAAPGETTLETVLGPFIPPLDATQCLLGRPECLDRDPCAAHEHWRAVTDQFRHFVRETVVADLVDEKPRTARRRARGRGRKRTG